MPEVVFVHCEADTLLRPRQDHLDLAASADALRSAGFGVREWTPGRGERPAAVSWRAQVSVVLPALRRTQLEPSREERLLVDEVVRLVSEGRPVLLTSGRSLLSLLGQPDPWQRVLQPFGLETDGARVVVELVAGEDGTPTPQSWQLVERFPEPPLAPRLAGRPLPLNQPMGSRIAEPAAAGVRP